MIKFLLPAALVILSVANIQADDDLMNFNDCFRISFNGEEVANGATLEINDFKDMSDLYGPGAITYSADIEVENLDIMPAYIDGTLYFTDAPTASQYQADNIFWGDPQLCYSINKNGSSLGNCLPANLPLYAGSGCFEVPVEGVGTFKWLIHIVAAQQNAVENYRLTLLTKTGDGADDAVISEPFTINLHFAAIDSGVNEIAGDADAPVEWFDLQGRRVLSPAQGLYICRQGSQISKRLLR
ncbi:MAG: hypothetical protein K2H35_05935 [Muribaculaceae bacterium]|nr:hypothetical protein [Muribaculaceae bacterium]